jgi:zinc/manganese transport system permease protein
LGGFEIFAIIAPALVAGFMISLINGPLGIEVLRRGIIFIDLAIAQVASLCVLFIDLYAHENSVFTRQASAFGAALLMALFFRIIEKKLPTEREPIIGACFILAASAVLLALANHPHGGEKMQDVLAGQILLVSWWEVLAFAPIFIVAQIAWFRWPAIRTGAGFYAIFSAVITASVQIAGIYVVFASLIFPALAVSTIKSKKAFFAIICGWLSVIFGVINSIWTDMPIGPLIVFGAALTTLVFRGLIFVKIKYK